MMNGLSTGSVSLSESPDFRAKCDLFSKQCAVLLAFVVPLSTLLTHIVLSCLLIAWFLAGSLEKKLKIIIKHPAAQASLWLWGVFLAGACYSPAPSADIVAMLTKMGKLLYISFLLPLMQEEKWRRAAFWAFCGAMALSFGLSFVKPLVGLPFGKHFPGNCAFRNPIFTNFMMAFASFMAGHYFLDALKANHKKNQIIWFALLVASVFYVCFMSTGRSGYAVFVGLWVLFSVQRFGFKGFVACIVGLTILLSLAFVGSTNFRDRLVLAVDNVEQYQEGNSDTSLGLRLEFATQSWKLAKEHVWFGFGTGAFKQVYQKHAQENALVLTTNPHNEYLNVLMQVGLVGLAFFCGMFLVLFKTSFQLPAPERQFAQGMMLSMLIGCMGNSWLMDFVSGYLFVIMIAFCFGGFALKGTQ
jgi:O-antigen ligase